MQIQKLTDKKLLEKTLELRKTERKIMREMLEFLTEIHKRRLYADLGYSTLDKFLTQRLGYSEGAAWRRIKAMKLVEEAPVVADMIESGEINLMNASKVHTAVKYSTLEVDDVLPIVANVSGDELDRRLFELSGDTDFIKRESKKRVGNHDIKLSVVLDEKIINKIEKLKAFKKQSGDQIIAEAIELLTQSSFTVKEGRVRRSKAKTLTKVIRMKVLARAKYCCEFPGCNERKFLEIDHIKPRALGGEHSMENLRVLCKSHNQRAAIKTYGKEKMQQFL